MWKYDICKRIIFLQTWTYVYVKQEPKSGEKFARYKHKFEYRDHKNLIWLRFVFLCLVDVRGSEETQPDLPVLRSADHDRVARQEAVVVESWYEGIFSKLHFLRLKSSEAVFLVSLGMNSARFKPD